MIATIATIFEHLLYDCVKHSQVHSQQSYEIGKLLSLWLNTGIRRQDNLPKFT